MTTDPYDPEYIDAKREELRDALAADGIEPEYLEEMDADDALDVIGEALLRHEEELPGRD